MVPSSQNCGPLVVAVLLLWFAAIASAQNDRHERIGYTKLVNWLGAAPVPDGSGVPVAQVEASTTVAPVTYLPWAGTGTFPGAGSFYMGKMFTAESNPQSGNQSGHANDVAGFFYNNLTDPNIDGNDRASVAPGVTTISCFAAGTYRVSEVSSAGSQDKKVHSNAWVDFLGSGSGASAAQLNLYAQNLDREADANEFIPVVGLNNGAGSSIPENMASAYNVISVGNSNGNHSSGTTPATVDGPGRVKPEVVAPLGTGAPLNATSYATGVVSGVTALLFGVANDNPALSNAYDEAEAMRAIIMAGATKEEFPTWSRTLASPLDSHFGAGEINVYESYRILTAGEQAAGGAVGRRGWDFGAVPNGSPAQEYTITVPNGCYADASIVVTWNRFQQGPNFIVRDLKLLLENPGGTIEWDQSDSAVDNVEHIYYRNLPPGQYVVRVLRNGITTTTTPYGLAWRVDLNKGPFMEATVAGADASLEFDHLDPGVAYTIERSPGDLATWTSIHTFMPATPTNSDTPYIDVNAMAVGDNVHYRLVWAFLTN